MRIAGSVVVGRGHRWEREALIHEFSERLVGMVGDTFGYAAVDVQREYRFDNRRGRRWRFDIAILPARVAVEIQGFHGGGHGGPRGYRLDCEKFTEAGAQGWTVLPVTYAMLQRGGVVDQVQRAISSRAAKVRGPAREPDRCGCPNGP